MIPPLQLPEDASGLCEDVLDWFIRRRRDGWSVQDEAAFQNWLAADVSHRATFAQWESRWTALDTIPADAVAQLRRNLERDKAREAAQRDEAPHAPLLRARGQDTLIGMPRRRVLVPAFATAAMMVVAGGGSVLAWNHWQAQPAFKQAFSTRRGQQVEVPLPDGSRVRLDTATNLEVAYYRQRREVRLRDGQAVFNVQADASRPFRVLAGPVAVTVVGTRFSVRYTPELQGDEGVRVLVEEGRVRVARFDGNPGDALHEAEDAVYLAAGEQVQADTQGRLAPVAAVSGEGIAPWRDNRISFLNTPLVRAIAELERYGSTGLTVRDPVVAQLRLSGTFDPRDPHTLQRILPIALPVRLQGSGAFKEVLPAR